MGNREWSIQLKDAHSGEAIITAGGVCYVSAGPNDPAKATLYDKDGASLSNPVALTRGNINFFVADTVDSVDLFIQAPGGQFLVVNAVKPSGPNEVLVDTARPHQVMIIPFAQGDFTANTETDTGFDEPANALFLADSTSTIIRLTTADDSETIDVGTATAESGDPNGFLSAAVLTTIGIVRDESTVGALLVTLLGHISTSKSIVITTSAGSDTGEGYIHLPYLLCR